jgi:methionine sulfoxide reductase heme-binding subunit
MASSRVALTSDHRAVRSQKSGTPDAWLKPGILVGALVPLVSIVVRALRGVLEANPIAQVENELGLAALILLVASLACTPARRLFGWRWPARIRRELGLLAFGYASLHVLVYVFLDQIVDPRRIFEDIVKRPFITVGLLALLMLVPLALTSTTASVRRLGFVRWQRLHQLAYAAGILAVIHFIWRVKIDVSQPVTYAVALGLLLAVRVGFWLTTRARPGRSAISKGFSDPPVSSSAKSPVTPR